MSESASAANASDALAELREAHAAHEDVRQEIAEVGRDRVVAAADAYREALGLLERYEGRATGTGDFQAFVEFQERFVDFVEELPGDLPAREAFEEAEELLDQRRLSESDFERARELLADAEPYVDLLERRDRTEERLRDAVHAVRERKHDLEDRVADLERLQRLGEAYRAGAEAAGSVEALDEQLDALRETVREYDECVRTAFETFLADASARRVFEFIETTEQYPLVAFRQPPSDLREYVFERPAGEEPLPTLVEYADYSRSKLGHYVDDPGALKTRVAVHRTYLERLGPEPLTVDWPPPEAARLRFRARELVAVVARFAEEETVAAARSLRALTDRPDYDRLRDAAAARAELDPAERERVRSGAVAAELEAAREERDRLAEALAEYG